MKLQIKQSFFQKIRSFFEQTETSIAKMTQKTPDFFCFMTVINMKFPCLKSFCVGRSLSTNQTFIVLRFDHFFKFFRSNSISMSQARCSRIAGRFISIFCSPRSNSFVMTNFANIKSSISIFVFVKFFQRISGQTGFTDFEFV